LGGRDTKLLNKKVVNMKCGTCRYNIPVVYYERCNKCKHNPKLPSHYEPENKTNE